MIRLVVMIASLWVFLTPAGAHELRPGFLEIRQEAQEQDRYVIRFKVPARGDMRLSLRVRLPADCKNVSPPRTERAGTGMIDRLQVSCPGGLENREIAIDGLASTFTDVVVRAVGADGTVQTARLTPDQPSLRIQASPSWRDTASTYFLLGLEHILLGLDHLLFVLALLLLIHDRWMLVKTITAFTIAHSITLAAAALGFAEAPHTGRSGGCPQHCVRRGRGLPPIQPGSEGGLAIALDHGIRFRPPTRPRLRRRAQGDRPAADGRAACACDVQPRCRGGPTPVRRRRPRLRRVARSPARIAHAATSRDHGLRDRIPCRDVVHSACHGDCLKHANLRHVVGGEPAYCFSSCGHLQEPERCDTVRQV